MALPKLFMTCPAFPGIVEALSAYFEVEASQDEISFSQDQLIEKIRDKAFVFTAGNARFSEAVLAHAKHLEMIAAMTVGYDNIDVAACNARGIVVSHSPDVLNQTTADFAWALLMATARRVVEAEQWLRAGHWQRWQLRGFLGADVHGKTLGILGMGRIGQVIAHRSSGFDMQVLYHNRQPIEAELERYANHAVYVDKERLLRESDFLVLMLPYSTANRHCMGEYEFSLMKPSAILINTSRGGVVDDQALISALKQRKIAAAGIDVFENEPAFDPAFLELDNVVLTPHIASASEATRMAMQQCAVDNLVNFVRHGTVKNLAK